MTNQRLPIMMEVKKNDAAVYRDDNCYLKKYTEFCFDSFGSDGDIPQARPENN